MTLAGAKFRYEKMRPFSKSGSFWIDPHTLAITEKEIRKWGIGLPLSKEST